MLVKAASCAKVTMRTWKSMPALDQATVAHHPSSLAPLLGLGRGVLSQADLIPSEQRFGSVICSHIGLLAFIVEDWPWFTLRDMFGRAQGVGLSSSSLSVIYRYRYLWI